MIRISNVERDDKQNRYVIEFTDGKLTWSKFLYDDVIYEPFRFKHWMVSMIDEIQLKGK
ncbi:MAG TPA: hypothetical protein PLS50_00610 [Candidatus Dojkabacteria bacterium]|nr:hypothetical protein [Candidatus Dojkabacteria bacterium]